jgi:hypothetical protein
MSVPKTAGRIVRNGLSWEQRGFTRIPNDWARDKRISYRARGILTYLMSHDAGWSITLRDLAADTRDESQSAQEGLSAVRSAVNELEAAGYIKRAQKVTEGGRFGVVVWMISDPHDERVQPVDNSQGSPMALDGVPEGYRPVRGKKARSEPLCDSPISVEPTTGGPTTAGPTTAEPTSVNRTTTEEHSPEEQDQKTNVRTPTGHVENVSTGVFPGSAQGSVERCSASRSGVHNPDPASGWCLNECGVRVADQIGAVA